MLCSRCEFVVRFDKYKCTKSSKSVTGSVHQDRSKHAQYLRVMWAFT